MDINGVKLREYQEERVAGPNKCIICQQSTTAITFSPINGRKRVIDAAFTRNDIVSKRLKQLGEQSFVYHVNNTSNRRYTIHKPLD
jgi:hypothetical protein